LLTAIGLVQIRQSAVRRIGLALIILYALVQYVGLTMGLSSRVAGIPARAGWTLGPLAVTLYAEGVHIASPARVEDWLVDAILGRAMADARERSLTLPIHLLMIPAMDSFDAQTMTYAKWRDRLPIDVSLVTGIVDVDSDRAMQESDYVVTKRGDLGWDFVLQDADQLTAQLLDPNSPLATNFELLAEFPLPDHSQALLFRHIRQSSQ
jgi:hypothetical protein